MTDSPEPTLHDHVSSFVQDLQGYVFSNNSYNVAVQDMFVALGRYDWPAVHEILMMFKRDFIGAVSDQANMYIGMIENANVLVAA